VRLDHLLSKENISLKNLLFIFQCTFISTLITIHMGV
jgi:hypothetical protein